MSLSIRMEMRVFLRPLTEDVHIPDSRTSSSIEGFLQASKDSSGRCSSSTLVSYTTEGLAHHAGIISYFEQDERGRSWRRGQVREMIEAGVACGWRGWAGKRAVRMEW